MRRQARGRSRLGLVVAVGCAFGLLAACSSKESFKILRTSVL
ncbi:MAG TPA: hypothetical protein VN811_04970 [Thermoanaerobaculia bacterium]|nr:hypothetical protein [Thermoanaerobaculia bacterium]HXT50369.1 hypothetical protein [Thermoanaerobaculia bacterium]